MVGYILFIFRTKLISYFLEMFDVDDDDCLWLKVNTGPWDEVCRRWKLTSKTRLQSYGQRSLSEIIGDWAVLKLPEALQLVSI